MPLIALAALVLCRVVVAIEGVDCPGDISIFGDTGIASVAATGWLFGVWAIILEPPAVWVCVFVVAFVLPHNVEISD